MTHKTDTALFFTDLAGHIGEWSPATAAVLDWPADGVAGERVSAFITTLDGTDPDEFAARAASGETVVVEIRWRRQERGPMRAALVVRSAAGADSPGLFWVVASKEAAEKDERAARHLAAIIESSDDAIISKDLDGIVTSWNRAAERIFGYSSEEMIGASIRTIIPDERQSEEDTTLATIRRGGRVAHFETMRRRKSGELIPISLTVSPIRTEDGHIVGASKIARDITDMKRAEAERFRMLEETARLTQTLNDVGSVVASDLERSTVVQAVTDAATELTTAEFGAFFYNVSNEAGESYMLYTVSGVAREAFATFPMPRNTHVFEPTFTGTAVVRSHDITADPRYGQNPPFYGMPPGHLPVRSYLAVPVKSPSGDIVGGLFFGHPAVGRFSEQHERVAVGIASWASVALENARLYRLATDANRLKDEFLASLSHELRTPLNAILGYVRLVRGGIVTGDKQTKALEIIERNATSLGQIVEDILDVSRIISGKMRLDVQSVDFPDVVQAAIDAVAPAADARGVRLEALLDPRASPVAGDPARLQQVLWNLMSNAVKFTPRGGKVQVRLERVNSHVEVVVSDTGIGIDAEFLPHIFERFRQANASTTRDSGGLGLGLAITRDLVELHGGTISVASGGPGQGSTFRVHLPVVIVHPAREQTPRAHPRVPRTPLETVMPDLTGIHVLAVDDDRDALSLVADVLRSAGALVRVAHSATDALALLDAEAADVLVADLGMPAMDGFELMGRVRRHHDPRVREMPAAALTAYARSEDRTKALRSGFQIHLAKPIEPAELMTTVAALARRYRGPESQDGTVE